MLLELHEKLKNATTVTERDREILTRLSADIRSLLAHPAGLAAAKHLSILDRLRETITSFEVAHPDLTEVMARISRILADMGI